MARNWPGRTVPDTPSIIFFCVVTPGLQHKHLPTVILAVMLMLCHES